MNKAITTTAYFIALYVAVLTMTYILPYFGSNSLLALGLTNGLTFLWSILHLTALVFLVFITFKRARFVNKEWLWYLPLTAAFFDMLPVLSSIPFIPTLFHLGTLAAVIVYAEKKNLIT